MARKKAHKKANVGKDVEMSWKEKEEKIKALGWA